AGDATAPEVSAMTVSLLAGIGAEFRVYGPLALDLSLRYNGGLTNLYKQVITHSDGFTETNSPLTYTVKDGERIKSLTDYVTASKLSQLSVNISLIYRF
ncbi:MAG: hypothetical protein K2G05_00920, partial [Duncaniella sp.]|nr:hypothetical protein [Duncaniella sp.]